MFVKIENGVARKHGGLAELRKQHPDTSFPVQMSIERLAEWGVFLFDEVPKPQTVSPYQRVVEGPPEMVGLAWRQTWIIQDIPAEEAEAIRFSKWEQVRDTRAHLLRACDWTQLPDVVMGEAKMREWLDYRQALRDITDQPDPFNIVWPERPKE
jgi:hypothetical protein